MTASIKNGDAINIQEIVSLFSSAAGEFAYASNTLGDLTAIFEGIVASTEAHTLAHRLAKLGERLSEESDAEMLNLRDQHNDLAERYSTIEAVPKTEGA